MTENRSSVFAYFNVTESMQTIDRVRLEAVRSAYANIRDDELTDTQRHNAEEKVKLLTDKFPIMNDAENLALLNKCVLGQYLELACQAIFGDYVHKRTKEMRRARTNNTSTTTSTISNQTTGSPAQVSTASNATEPLPKAFCQILLKKNPTVVFQFIQNFLLCPIHQTPTKTM
ncbi:unnamed protein product [Rotaria socialis]|uniref:Uncharacterized protein n=1 Tax=Rotaria socialis TaxID=392032 RepID=A0A818NA19_9BILA|nr:unnamed protein product [Rotaria socialis]CAF4753699.1 unnamed protein product [Rotaria socialis]